MKKIIDKTYFVPVTTTDPRFFLKVDREGGVNNIIESINKLLRSHIKILSIPYGAIEEIVRNSFDAYSSSGLVQGDRLEIQLIVLEDRSDFKIKIKDNGPGFAKKERRVLPYFLSKRFNRTFSTSDIVYSDKFAVPSLGGLQIGLSALEKTRKSFALKNRISRSGASVEFMLQKQTNIKGRKNNSHK